MSVIDYNTAAHERTEALHQAARREREVFDRKNAEHRARHDAPKAVQLVGMDPAAQEHWDAWFAEQFAAHFQSYFEGDDGLAEGIGAVIGTKRAECRKDIDALRGEYETKIAELEARIAETARPAPIAMVWTPESITYRGGFATHQGVLYQATRDSAKEPGKSADWLCVARAGTDGKDGKSVRSRGLYNPAKTYEKLDLVMFAGEAFLARLDAPGPLPDAPGWSKVGARGRKGDRGERGATGARGAAERPVTVRSWQVDDARYRATPLLSNGQVGASLELRPLFAMFLKQTTGLDHERR
jgi:hypothetical protein